MLRIIKEDEQNMKVEEFGTFKFVPMLEQTVKKNITNENTNC
jgi:hypothetical protein